MQNKTIKSQKKKIKHLFTYQENQNKTSLTRIILKKMKKVFTQNFIHFTE